MARRKKVTTEQPGAEKALSVVQEAVKDSGSKAAEVETAEVQTAKEEPAETSTQEKTEKAPKEKKPSSRAAASKKAEDKQAAKKTAVKKEIKVKAVVQYQGKQVEEKEIIGNVKKAWTKTGGKVRDIRSIDLYIKPEEDKVYYVVNGTDTGDVAL
jgi:hypothetical protein